MEDISFVDSKERQQRARGLGENKYASKEDRSIGLLRDYDSGPKLAEEVRERKPWKIYVICLAGENRSRLIAEVLDDKDVKGKPLRYFTQYGGTNFSFPVMEEEIREFSPDAIIFATRQTQSQFEKKFPKMFEEDGVLKRVIGLDHSKVDLHLDEGGGEVERLKIGIRNRLKEMGFEGLTEEDLRVKWSEM